MSERTCKKCGSIDYDIWGCVGLIGYSLIIGVLGYSLALIIYFPNLIVIGAAFGTCLMVPICFISYHEQKETVKNDKKKIA